MAQKDMPASRERRMRRAAARKGLAVRKLDHGKDRGRFQLIDPEFGGPRASPSREHPTTFSLEEAESYLDASGAIVLSSQCDEPTLQEAASGRGAQFVGS